MAQLRMNSSSTWKCPGLANMLADGSGGEVRCSWAANGRPRKPGPVTLEGESLMTSSPFRCRARPRSGIILSLVILLVLKRGGFSPSARGQAAAGGVRRGFPRRAVSKSEAKAARNEEEAGGAERPSTGGGPPRAIRRRACHRRGAPAGEASALPGWLSPLLSQMLSVTAAPPATASTAPGVPGVPGAPSRPPRSWEFSRRPREQGAAARLWRALFDERQGST